MGRLTQPNKDDHRQPAVADNHYHPELIAEYRQTHRELERLFACIGTNAESGKYDRIHKCLTAFVTRLEGHLLNENTCLYGYVERQLAQDKVNFRLAQQFRQEMDTIADQVIDFVNTWREQEIAVNNVEVFMQQYRKVGDILKQRLIAEERDLYPLYHLPF